MLNVIVNADLHCHSTYSDGSCDVSEIVDYALRIGLSHIALSDHDTLAGISDITNYAKCKPITIIPAMEITTRDYKRKRNVHLLCYYPKHDKRLLDITDNTVFNRNEIKLQTIEKLKYKYPIKLEDVLAIKGKSVAVHEPHIVKVLANMGYTKIMDGEFLNMIFGEEYANPQHYPDIWDIAKLLKDINCPAVIAHPGQFDSLELANELCKNKLLAGIECYHPRNSEAIVAACIDIADKYNIIKTGGSDFHGYYAIKPKPLGFCTVGNETVKQIIEYQM